MSAYYGTLTGNRGTVTRTGSLNSGMECLVKSYNMKAELYMFYNNATKEDNVKLVLSDEAGSNEFVFNHRDIRG